MKKKNNIAIIIIALINIIISYIKAKSSWINRMPPINTSVFAEIIEAWLVPSLIISLLSITIFFVINRLIIKENVSILKYIVFLIILIVVNITIYGLFVEMVY